MRYALIGYGRMGRAIEEVASKRGHTLGIVVDPVARGRGVRRKLAPDRLGEIEVAFEFTVPSAAEENVIRLLEAGVRVVSGTTGWKPGASRFRRAMKQGGAGAVVAPNFSLGMNLFYGVTREASRLLAATELYEPFILETHHRGKVDAPSGTALRLAELVSESGKVKREVVIGTPDGPVPGGAVHVTSVRAGHEPGTHVVGFDGEHDVLRFSHSARGRGGFALGAVLAGEWVRRRRGLHGFERVIQDLLKKGGRR